MSRAWRQTGPCAWTPGRVSICALLLVNLLVTTPMSASAAGTTVTAGWHLRLAGIERPGLHPGQLDASVQEECSAKIAFVSERDGNEDIYTVNPDGSQVTRITYNQGYDTDPSWSPDGRKIVFASERSGLRGIYVMDADGQNVVLVSSELGGTVPAWSPDGGTIAFRSIRDESDLSYSIHTTDTAGRHLERLTYVGKPASGWALSWSPDGSWLAYASGGAVYVTSRDGRSTKKVVEAPVGPDWGGLGVAWSPDGAHLAFSAYWGGNEDIYTVDSSGQHLTRLTVDPGVDRHPTWSPDGKRIAFESNRSGQWAIYVMESGGGNAVRITDDSTASSRPSWQPCCAPLAAGAQQNGSHYSGPGASMAGSGLIAYVDPAGDVCVMNADGSGARKVTSGGRYQHPTWSPDGRSLAFWSGWDLYVATLPTLEVKRLGTFNTMSSAWLPDSRRLAVAEQARLETPPDFESCPTGRGRSEWKVSTIDVTTGSSTLVTSMVKEVCGGIGGASDPLRIFKESEQQRWGGVARGLRWSPDGRKFVLESPFCRFLVDYPSGATTDLLTEETQGGVDWSKQWFQVHFSPSGEETAYCGGRALYLVDASGVTREICSLGEVSPFILEWSPDGEYLYYDAFDWRTTTGELRRVRVQDGQSAVVYAPNYGTVVGRLSCSPDGEHITFSIARGDPESVAVMPPSDTSIWVADADGQNAVEIARGCSPDWQPRQVASVTDQSFQAKEKSISRLSHPTFSFLGFAVPAKGYDESKASELLSRMRTLSSAGTLTPPQVSAFYRLVLTEQSLVDYYDQYALIADDAADDWLSFSGCLLGTARALNRAAAVLGGQSDSASRLESEILLRQAQIMVDLLDSTWDLAEYRMPQGMREDSAAFRRLLMPALALRLEDGSALGDILKDTVLKGSLDAFQLDRYVTQTQETVDRAVNSADPEYGGPDRLTARDLDRIAEINSQQLVNQTRYETDLAHSNHNDYRRGAAVAETEALIGDLLSLAGPGTALGQLTSAVGKALRLIVNGYSGYRDWQQLSLIRERALLADDVAFDPRGAMPELSRARSASEAVRAAAVRPDGVGWRSGQGANLLALAPTSTVAEGELPTQLRAVLAEIASAVEQGDQDRVERLLPTLIAVDEGLTAMRHADTKRLLAGSTTAVDVEHLHQSYVDKSTEMLSLYGNLLQLLCGSDEASIRSAIHEGATRIAEGYPALVRQTRDAAQATTLPTSAPVVALGHCVATATLERGKSGTLNVEVVNVSDTAVEGLRLRLLDSQGEVVTQGQPASLSIAERTRVQVPVRVRFQRAGLVAVCLELVSGEQVLDVRTLWLEVAEPALRGPEPWLVAGLIAFLLLPGLMVVSWWRKRPDVERLRSLAARFTRGFRHGTCTEVSAGVTDNLPGWRIRRTRGRGALKQMFCPRCKQSIRPTSRFCPFCGCPIPGKSARMGRPAGGSKVVWMLLLLGFVLLAGGTYLVVNVALPPSTVVTRRSTATRLPAPTASASAVLLAESGVGRFPSTTNAQAAIGILAPTALTRIPTPTPTASPTASPTAAPSASPTCPALPDPGVPPGIVGRLGCVLAPSAVVWSAWQPFERGFMLWRSDTKRITAFFADATWASFADQWDGRSYDLGSPPEGKIAPIRGFGWVWMQHPEVASRLGWGLQQEKGFCARIQSYEHGFVLRSVKEACSTEYNRANDLDFADLFLVVSDAGSWTTR